SSPTAPSSRSRWAIGLRFAVPPEPSFMIRLTGGEFRGRGIRTPREPSRGESGTRPTQAKLRQALFNSLQLYIPGAVVLDLFAGPGTLGFEALSRGAEK